MKFMRKYIHVARDMCPVLTREAADVIADEYSKLRSQDNISQDNIAKVRKENESNLFLKPVVSVYKQR